MKIAIIGYGKMGHIVEQIAKSRGHEIVAIIDADTLDLFDSKEFASADVAIEFTMPSQAIDNYRRAWKAGVPVVSGTTGWISQIDEVRREIEEKNATLFWTSNFSLGVNILFELNRHLARIMNRYTDYTPAMEEVHHTEKKDAPSGTAITLAEEIIHNIDRIDSWHLAGETAATANSMKITAIREGKVPGIHTIAYDSPVDTITIRHEAKSREGLALGAVLAAEFTIGKKGFLSMSDMLQF